MILNFGSTILNLGSVILNFGLAILNFGSTILSLELLPFWQHSSHVRRIDDDGSASAHRARTQHSLPLHATTILTQGEIELLHAGNFRLDFGCDPDASFRVVSPAPSAAFHR